MVCLPTAMRELWQHHGTARPSGLYLGKERGLEFRVFADETRPLLQGARLTTFELDRAGVDVTLICDNMASIVMKNGWVQACLWAVTGLPPTAMWRTNRYQRSSHNCQTLRNSLYVWDPPPPSIWIVNRR